MLEYSETAKIKDDEIVKLDINGTTIWEPYEWVDLGLSSGTLWCNKNLGAKTSWDYGDYFQWASPEIATNKTCNWYNTPYKSSYYGEWGAWRKYVDSDEYEENEYFMDTGYSPDDKTQLEDQDNASKCLMGEDYDMPTRAQILELVALTHESATVNGVSGVKIIGNNGNYIFIPNGGFRGDSETISGSSAYLMSKTVSLITGYYVLLYSLTNDKLRYTTELRCYATPIRPVKTKTT